MLGIIGAMQAEIDLLLREMENVQKEETALCALYGGTLRGVPVTLARSGIGKVYAALCAQRLILSRHPDDVLFIGVAGAIESGLAIGDAVLATHTVQHDIDTTALGDPAAMVSGPNLVRFPTDQGLLRLLRGAAEASGVRAVESGIATGDQFIADPEKKRGIAKAYAAAACDMETAAAAQACHAYNAPFAAVRTISDELLMGGSDYAAHMRTAADACARLTLGFCERYAKEGRHAPTDAKRSERHG